MQCLVIDQNSESRAIISAMLGELGFACCFLTEGADASPLSKVAFALIAVRDQSADLSAIRQLTQRVGGRPAIPVICFGDFVSIESVERCIVAGASDVLMRPFDVELLAFRLQQLGILNSSIAA